MIPIRSPSLWSGSRRSGVGSLWAQIGCEVGEDGLSILGQDRSAEFDHLVHDPDPAVVIQSLLGDQIQSMAETAKDPDFFNPWPFR